MHTARSAKLHISLPPDVYAFVMQRSTVRGDSVSAVVADSIRREMLAERRARLDEALALDAADNLAHARAVAPVVARVLGTDRSAE
jgi:hypothetical protein